MSNHYESYGEMFGEMVRRQAKDGRGVEDVCRIMNIPGNQYRKVINPNNLTNSGNPYYMPVEWLVVATNYSARFRADGVPGDYCMAKKVAKDIGCVLLTPDEISDIKNILMESAPDPVKVLGILQKLTAESK